jgi:acyl transferase domain-containing protein/acyl carrier protein
MKDVLLSGESLKIVAAAYKKLESIQAQKIEPIAVVGMSCRFPQANNLDAYWQILLDNVDTISKIPADRYNIGLYYSGQSNDKITSPYGGYLENVYDFDARFFDLSPKEALALDPQQRLLLEMTVEALENANQPIDKLSKVTTSVYIGISSFDYGVRLQSNEDTIDSYLGTGTLLSPAAGRISYFLNLTGPSMVIDTACSSSLVSIHQAIMSIRNHESDISIVGGVGLLLEPSLSICFSKATMLSPDGKCKTFDDSANGYVRSEGCAVIILKRLSYAIKNKDNIHGLIIGSAVNQDGASGGLTIPSGPSQEKVIQQAMLNSGIKVAEVDYVEAHGTATALGDPIEINALGEVFHDRDLKLKVGSVKTNIGHLEACSGLASVIKVILAMQHSLIPASLHFNRPNSRISWNDLPIEVVDKNTPWVNNDKKRIAGISAFGFSGTNCHIIVSEAPVFNITPPPQIRKGGVLTVSAKDKVSLFANMQRLQIFLQNTSDSIENICFTSNVGRTHYKERIALIANNKEQLLQTINLSIHAFHEVPVNKTAFYISGIEASDIKTEFIFSGMEEMSEDVCIHMYKHFQYHPYFQSIINKCKDICTVNHWITEQEWDDALNKKNVTKLLLNLISLIIHYALAKLIIYIGIKPKIVLGHGMGEYVAAGVAGIFSLEDMLYMIYNSISKKDNFAVLIAKITIKKGINLEFKGSLSNPYEVNTPKYWEFHSNQLDGSIKITRTCDCSVIIGASSLVQQEDNAVFSITNNGGINIDNFLPLIVSYFYSQGTDLIWDHYHQGVDYKKVNLPTYAWNKSKYMIENKSKQQKGYFIVQSYTTSSSTGIITFDCRISLEQFGYIKDHKIFGKIVFPESTYLEMFIEASSLLFPDNKNYAIKNIVLVQSYVFTDRNFVHMQLVCTPKENLSYDIALISFDNSGQTGTHVQGQVTLIEDIQDQRKQDLSSLQSNFLEQPAINVESYYQDFANTGVDYGPSFKSISQAFLSSDKSQVLGLIESRTNIGKSCLNPMLLDGCLQLIAACLDKNNNKSTYFIMSVGTIQYYRCPQQDSIWCHIKQHTNSTFPIFDLELFDNEGNLLVKISKLQINYGNASALILNKTKDWFYSISWKESSNNVVDITSKLDNTWLVLSDGDILANEIKRFLKNEDIKCIDINSLNYQKIIKEINGPIQGVIFVLGSNQELNDSINNTSLQLCSILLRLVQSLDTVNTRLCVITRNVHSDTEIRPQQSVLWGMGRVILLEHPKLNPIFIDYDHVFDGLIKNILLDILYNNNENQVVYKNGLRYIARLQYEHIIQTSSSYHIDPKSAYLVTGAFGALGMRITQLLVERGAKHLVLLSRSGATTEHAKSVLESFKNNGVNIKVLKLDISQNKIDQLNISVPLKGVIHTAGVLDDRLLSNHTESSFQKVLAPKIQGTWNLHNLTKNQDLDFFVCFSSMTSVIGAIGQGNYAAANYFMDIFCHYRRSKNLPAISISWGPWDGAGMGAKKELLEHWSNMGMRTINIDEGVLIFEKLLGTNYAHIGVMPTNWNKYPDQNNFFEVLKAIKKKDKQSGVLLELRKANVANRRKILVEYVESEICQVLGYELGKQSFEEDQGFFELGMNSLTAIEFKNKLQDTLDCQLSSTLTFDYPTIAKLVNYLDSEVISSEDKQQDTPVEIIEEDDDEYIFKKLSEQLDL